MCMVLTKAVLILLSGFESGFCLVMCIGQVGWIPFLQGGYLLMNVRQGGQRCG